jgi:hypothetical protein
MRTHSTRLLALMICAVAACDHLPSTPPQPDATPSAIEPGEGPSLATNISVICLSNAVPTGYVVMRYDRSVNCPNYSTRTYNAYLIAQPGSPETVCTNSIIPPGWVTTSYGRSSICPNYSAARNRVTIKIPGTSEIVCTNSYVPAGYLTVRYGARPSCPDGQVKFIQAPVGAVTVCSSNSVPTGWIIFYYARAAYCPGYSPSSFNIFRIGPPPGTVARACANSDQPQGWVIKYYTRDTRCPGYTPTAFNVVAFALPVNGTWACRWQNLPAGWYFDKYANSPACYPGYGGDNQGRLHHN